MAAKFMRASIEPVEIHAGPGALRRAKLAKQILEERFKLVGLQEIGRAHV